MPKRTYITAEENKLHGYKPMKDTLTLALCANSSGDFTVKPLLVYIFLLILLTFIIHQYVILLLCALLLVYLCTSCYIICNLVVFFGKIHIAGTN